jgi:phosphatidylglycerol:prolipoprotein diacylglycerol transferase
MQIRVKTGDSLAVPVAAAVAVGRLACFAGGCCFGTETTLPWGIVFGDGGPRHPAQLYESAFHSAAAIGLGLLFRRELLRGQLIKLYIIGYLLFRFATEFIRPEPVLFGGLTGYQLAALALVPVFGLLWIKDRHATLRP